jgi:hypothetical protein
VTAQLFRRQQTVLRSFYRRGYINLYPLYPRVLDDKPDYWFEEICRAPAANDPASVIAEGLS